MKYFLPFCKFLIFSFFIYGCISPEEKAKQNPAKNLCPNLGIINLKEIDPNSFYEGNFEIAVKTRFGAIQRIMVHHVSKAKEIVNHLDYMSFLENYDAICGGEPPFINEIAYKSSLNKRQNMLDEMRKNDEANKAAQEQEEQRKEQKDYNRCINKFRIADLQSARTFILDGLYLKKDEYIAEILLRKVCKKYLGTDAESKCINDFNNCIERVRKVDNKNLKYEEE
ncbi:MAG: hypothetical protein L6Q54_03505 [Leptospiraceae bacterium]|nr:hypothetical protein [Leptospiraceae bacterium]